MKQQQIDITSSAHSPGKIIWKLAWPVMLEQILIMMVQYVDTAMVGAIGPNATAAVALTSSTNWLMNGIIGGAAVGFSVPIGNFIGAKLYDKARDVVRQSVIAIFIIGAVLTGIMLAVAPHLPHWLGGDPEICADATSYISIVCLAYIASISIQICSSILRCTGDTATPLVFNVSTNLINMVLNFLLIYAPREISVLGITFRMWGAGLGVSGAAIATAVANVVSGVMLLRAMFLKKFPCNISTRDKFRFDKAIWADMVRVGTPVTFDRVCVSLGQILMTAMVTSLGTASLAAHSLGITAESITYMPGFGGYNARCPKPRRGTKGFGKAVFQYLHNRLRDYDERVRRGAVLLRREHNFPVYAKYGGCGSWRGGAEGGSPCAAVLRPCQLHCRFVPRRAQNKVAVPVRAARHVARAAAHMLYNDALHNPWSHRRMDRHGRRPYRARPCFADSLPHGALA